jgi:hypothetical protein
MRFPHLSLVVLFAPFAMASAQDTSCKASTAPYAVVTGTLTDDSTGLPLSPRGVFLGPQLCWTSVAPDGTWRFDSVFPGYYRLSVGSLGYRNHEGVVMLAVAGDTAFIPLTLRPGEEVADCLDRYACREQLYPPREVYDELSAADQLFAAALMTAVTLSRDDMDETLVGICVGISIDPDDVRRTRELLPSLLEWLDSRTQLVRPLKGCRPTSIEHHERLRSRPGRAMRVLIAPPVQTAWDKAVFSYSYRIGPVWGAGFDCTLVRRDNAWRAELCTMAWIS